MKQLVIGPTLSDDQFPNWPIREVHLNSENEIKGVLIGAVHLRVVHVKVQIIILKIQCYNGSTSKNLTFPTSIGFVLKERKGKNTARGRDCQRSLEYSHYLNEFKIYGR